VLTRSQGSKPAGERPDCDNCRKSQAFCEWPRPGRACCCKRCNGMKLRCAVDGVPQSQNAGLS